VPEGVVVEQVEEKADWGIDGRGRTLVWTGRLNPGRLATFAVSASVEGGGELVRHTDGSTQTWEPTVAVGAATAGRDEGARTLGKAALFVAVAAGVLAVGAGFLGLWLWLRGSGD
jgi:hypothetical protein